MKRYLLASLLLFTSFSLWAQQYAIIGTGTGTNSATAFPAPMGNASYGAKHQMLITKDEMLAAGMVAGSKVYAIGFYVTSVGSMDPLEGWQIKVFSTSSTNPISTNWVTSGEVAYSLPTTYTPSTVGDWDETPLYNFFTWNGTDNLVVQTCFNNTSASENALLRRTQNLNTSPNAGGATIFTRLWRGNVAGVCDSLVTLQSNATRSNMRLLYSKVQCSTVVGAPVVGTVTASETNPVVTTNIVLSLDGTYPVDASIQWEEATSASGPWTPIAGATNVNWQYNAYFTKYYRAAVTCGSNTGYSNNVLVAVQDYFAAGTYTINNALPTGGTNFHTFAAFDSAASLVMSGHVVANVAAGTYTERLIISEPQTAANKTITINGNGATISHTTTTSAQRAAVVLDGANYVTIKNFNIKGYSTAANQYCWGVLLKDNCDYDTVTNCTITLDSNTASDHYAGIVMSNSDVNYDVTTTDCDFGAFTNNEINGGYYGIHVSGPTEGFYIGNNTVRNFYSTGIVVNSTDNVLVKGNDIHRKQRTNISDFTGIYATGSIRLKIHGNKLHDPSTAVPGSEYLLIGIQLSYSEGFSNSVNNEIHNNIFYNMNGIGDHFYMYNEESGNIDFYNNSINTGLNSIPAIGVTAAYYHYTADNAPYVRFRNNDILIDRRTENNIKMIMYIEDGEERIKSGYNNYMVKGPGYNYFANAEGEYCPTKAPFVQNHDPWEQNSVSLRSFPLAPSDGDLKPTNPSLNNLGDANLHATTDIVGTVRGATSDIGAYEYTPAACVPLPSGAYALCYDSIGCPGGPIELTLKNAPIGTGMTITWQASPANAGNWSNITTLSTGTGTYTVLATMPAVATDFRAVVVCSGNTYYSASAYVGKAPWYMCYCSPLTGDTLYQAADHYNLIENVSISFTTLDSPTPGTGNGSYDRKDPNIETNTGELTAGGVYSLGTQPAIITVIAWIDFDKDGLFEATEVVSGPTFTVPANVTDGPTGMRVRSTYAYPLGPNDACYKYSYAFSGETEDYVVTLDDPLKVDLTSITAANAGNRNRVDWHTGSEDKGDRFEIERSIDGSSFASLGELPAKGAASSYTYWDESPITGVNYYRLKMHNVGGAITYSEVVTATVRSTASFKLEVFPNPVKDGEITVRTLNTTGVNATVTITDVTGKVLSVTAVNDQLATVSLKGMAPGIYLVKYADKGHSETVKITRQ